MRCDGKRDGQESARFSSSGRSAMTGSGSDPANAKADWTAARAAHTRTDEAHKERQAAASDTAPTPARTAITAESSLLWLQTAANFRAYSAAQSRAALQYSATREPTADRPQPLAMGHSHSVPSLSAEPQAEDAEALQSPSITAAESQEISPPPPVAAAADAPGAIAGAADAAVPPPRARRVRSVRRAESLVSYLPSARSLSAPSQWSWTHDELFSTPPDPHPSAAVDPAAAADAAQATQSLLDDDDEMFDVDIDAMVAAATARSKDKGAQQISVTTETEISTSTTIVMEAQSASAASPASSSSSLAIVTTNAAATAAVPKSLFDDADDAMFDAVDIEALVAAASASAKQHKGARKGVRVGREAAIDLTDDPAPANAHHLSSVAGVASATAAAAAAAASASASSSVDIEDIAALCASTAAAASAAGVSSVAAAAAPSPDDDPLPTPLSLRNPHEPLAVTRFCELSWCELQLDFSLRLGKRAPSAAAQAVMDRGSAIHLEYELETTTHVEVQPESNEDVWALRIINMMLGLQELTATGRTREFPVFGCVRTPKPDRAVKPHAGSHSTPQPRWVWITGIVDEIVRADVFAKDQWCKQQARDELIAEEAAEKARAAAAAHRKPPLSRTKSEAASSAFDTKRKRSSSAVQTPDSVDTRVSVVASASPVLAVRAASSSASVAAASSPAPAPSALIDRTASFSQASLNPDEEWQIERQIGVELEQQSKENTRPQANVASPSASSPTSMSSAPAAASPKSATSGAGSPMSLASASASPVVAPSSSSSSPAPSSHTAAAAGTSAAPRSRPRAPPPDFPVSDRYLVLDHKTRMANSMPMQSQKAATYLQVSIYKHLIDRWLGTPTSDSIEVKQKQGGAAKHSNNGSRDEQKHSSAYAAAASASASASSSADPSLSPPFPLSLFYSHFSLDPQKPLCASLRSHLESCGLSRDFTLEDLLNFLLSMAKASPQTDREMKVEYQWQKDKRVRERGTEHTGGGASFSHAHVAFAYSDSFACLLACCVLFVLFLLCS